jgi:hypothetical protein
VVWPVDRPDKPRPLVAPIPLNAVDIDDDGTVLGSVFTAQAASYLWAPDGTAKILRGPSGGTDVYTVAIQGGWTAGTDNFTSGGTTVAWRDRQTNVVPAESGAYSVNGHGDVGLQDAIDRRRGGLTIVPNLGGSTGVTALSDRKIAAGFAYDGYQVHAVSWHNC